MYLRNHALSRFVCWRDPIWYRDRVGRREPAVPRVHEGRVKTWRPAGRVPATRTVTRARQPASSETGSRTRLPRSSASTFPSFGSTSTRAPPARASRSATTTRAWRRWSSAWPPSRPGSTHEVRLDQLGHVGVVPGDLLALAPQAGGAGLIGAGEVEGDPAQAGEVARGPPLRHAAGVLAEDDVQNPVL